MGFRFRKRTGLLGGLLKLNWSKKGLSSISLGVPGATYNVPVAREGNARTTVGLPGTGLSYQTEARPSVRERQRKQRPQQPTTEALIDEVMKTICGPEAVGDALWRQGLVERVLELEDTPRRVREAALLVKSPESCELHMRRAKGAAATRRAAVDVLNTVQVVLDFGREQGWTEAAD